MIRRGMECNGYWAVDISEAGTYRFELCRWPHEEGRAITEGIPGEQLGLYHGGRALDLKTAHIRIGEQDATQEIAPDATGVTFTFDLQAGETRLHTLFSDEAGELAIGAYYVYVTRVV